MGKLIDICAIDGGQTGVRFRLYDAGRLLCEGSRNSGLINLVLEGAPARREYELTQVIGTARSVLGTGSFGVVSVVMSGISNFHSEYEIASRILNSVSEDRGRLLVGSLSWGLIHAQD
jgi:hypothetical protein